MDTTSISYLITAFAPQHINDNFIKAKKEFKSFNEQKMTLDHSVITMNTAHVTIKGRFYMKNGVDEKVLIEVLNNIVFPQVSIHADSLIIFKTQQHGNIVVSMIKQPEGLIKLHKDILQRISPYIDTQSEFEWNSYTPHISILYDLPINQLEVAMKYIEKNILPITFMIDNINILKNIPNIKNERAFLKTYTVG